MVRVTTDTMGPSAHGKGFVNYILDGVKFYCLILKLVIEETNKLNTIQIHNVQQCDLLIADVATTDRTLAVLDFTLPWDIGVVSFLIPVPDDTANINAIAKPFKWLVYNDLYDSN